jgi:hypothetical protein
MRTEYDGRPKKGWLVQWSSRGSAADSVVETAHVVGVGRWTRDGEYNLTVLTKSGIETWKMGNGYLGFGESERWMNKKGHRLVPKTKSFLKILESGGV